MRSLPTSGHPSGHDDSDVPAPTTRRAMVRSGAIREAVGPAATAAHASTATAADGETLGVTDAPGTTTNLSDSGPPVAAGMNVQPGDQTVANDGILNSVFASAGRPLLGVAAGNGHRGIGVIGWSKRPLGVGLVGFTGPAGGGEFLGGRAAVRLRPGGNQPVTLTDSHQVGERWYADDGSTPWLCIAAGAPGTWRAIAGPTSAGAFHAIAPRRVDDSRTATSQLDAGIDRVLSVVNPTDGTLDVVPALATAVSPTVTITQTEAIGGYVPIRRQDATLNDTSSINRSGPDRTVGTSVVSALGDGHQIIARGGGNNRTHLVIDATGYRR